MTAPAIATPSAEDTPTAPAPDAGAPTPSNADAAGDALGAEIGQLFGEGGDTPAAGDPRGVTVEKPAATADAKPADTTAPAKTEAAPPTPTAPVDPMAGTQPFTYGDGKKIDGVYVVPATADDPGGVIIPTANMHILQSLAEERDALDVSSREYQESAQQYERLSAWTTTDRDGKESTITGSDAMVAMRVELGRQASENEALRAVIADPQKLLGLLLQDKDGKISIDQGAVRALHLEIKDVARDTEDHIRHVLAGIVQAPRAPATPAAATGAAPDVTAAAPAIIEAAAKAVGIDGKTLHEKDRAFLASQLPRYMRTVTDSDRRMQPHLKIGQPIVDASFTQVVKHQAELRAEMAKTAATVTTAATENAVKLAAAGLTKPAATPKPAPVAPAKPKLSDADKAYRMREAAAAGRRYDPEADD